MIAAAEVAPNLQKTLGGQGPSEIYGHGPGRGHAPQPRRALQFGQWEREVAGCGQRDLVRGRLWGPVAASHIAPGRLDVELVYRFR